MSNVNTRILINNDLWSYGRGINFVINMETKDLQLLMVSAARYSFNRQTYIVSMTCELIEKYLDQLTDHTIAVILRDLQEAISERKKYTTNIDIDLPYLLKLEMKLMERLK